MSEWLRFYLQLGVIKIIKLIDGIFVVSKLRHVEIWIFKFELFLIYDALLLTFLLDFHTHCGLRTWFLVDQIAVHESESAIVKSIVTPWIMIGLALPTHNRLAWNRNFRVLETQFFLNQFLTGHHKDSHQKHQNHSSQSNKLHHFCDFIVQLNIFGIISQHLLIRRV